MTPLEQVCRRARQGPKKAKEPNKTELRYLRENVEPLGQRASLHARLGLC